MLHINSSVSVAGTIYRLTCLLVTIHRLVNYPIPRKTARKPTVNIHSTAVDDYVYSFRKLVSIQSNWLPSSGWNSPIPNIFIKEALRLVVISAFSIEMGMPSADIVSARAK